MAISNTGIQNHKTLVTTPGNGIRALALSFSQELESRAIHHQFNGVVGGNWMRTALTSTDHVKLAFG